MSYIQIDIESNFMPTVTHSFNTDDDPINVLRPIQLPIGLWRLNLENAGVSLADGTYTITPWRAMPPAMKAPLPQH